MGCLYKLTSPAGKSYIGITSRTLDRRWRQHCANARKGRGVRSGAECCALYSAIRKYGAEAFSRSVLLVSDDWATLCRMEQQAIAVHGTFSPDGYNLTFGGDGAVGARPTLEARIKMSAAQRRRLTDPHQLQILRNALVKAVESRRAKWWARTPEERQVWGQEHSKKISAGHSTPESKVRSSRANRRTWADPAYRAKMSAIQTGITRAPWTPERKQRAAAARLKEWADPKMRAKRLAGYARARAKVA